MNPNSQERSEFFYQGQNIKGYGSGNNTPNYTNRKIIQRNNIDNGLGKKISPSKTQQNKRIIIDKENQSNSTYKTNNRPNSTNTNNSNKYRNLTSRGKFKTEISIYIIFTYFSFKFAS